MIYSRSSYLKLPEKSGVYRFLDSENDILYVGKAKNLKARISSYFTVAELGVKTKILVSRIKKIKVTFVESELEALLLEAFYIKKFQPKYNILQKDNKSYIRIRINVRDNFPAVLLSRNEDDPNSLYFGPYPVTRAVKLVMKTVRKIFPYQSAINHPKKLCLYNHLGLCPCPPVLTSGELSKYRRDIKKIIDILEGKSKIIMRGLEKQRNQASKEERFEEAMILQQKINALSIITTPFHKPFEYDLNPNLRLDKRSQEISVLRDILNNIPYTPAIKKLNRIECYDISNTQGTHPTASMVVLTKGEIDKSQYRKFRMRSIGPNDFVMIKEALSRRLKHLEWEYPDLIVVDGGRGQVSSALNVLRDHKLKIPLIGLAKREEKIIAPLLITEKELGDDRLTFKEITLSRNSPALQLIMRIRDEAHRFAITYHRFLRGKSALDNQFV